MKRTVVHLALALGLMCGVGSEANATILCGPPHQTLGKVGTNPVISTVVWHSGPNWNVIYRLKDGRPIDRSTQYTMTDDSSSDGARGWHGWSKTNPHLWMTGVVVAHGDDDATYTETLHDDHLGDIVVMHSDTECHKTPPQAVSGGEPTYN
jgi:hypothetical protein